MFFWSPADHRTSCSLFQRCQPAKKWLFFSISWCHWVLKAETCPQHVEGEASCPRVILILVSLRGCCERDLFSLLLQVGSPPILLTAHLERAHPQETIKLTIILVVYALIQKCFLAKREKKNCGNFHSSFFLLLNKLGQDPNEGGWLCWLIKG